MVGTTDLGECEQSQSEPWLIRHWLNRIVISVIVDGDHGNPTRFSPVFHHTLDDTPFVNQV